MSGSGRAAHHYIWLSIAAAIVTIVLKSAAWWVTGSAGLLSDALESFVNLAGAGFALWMLLIAHTPPDERHPWGHTKAEYFSSGFEGTLIFIAAVLICISAIPRLLHPEPLQRLDFGLLLAALSAVINFATAHVLQKAGQRLHSIALEADAKHLMTDVWTTVGVIAGLGLVYLTDWLWLDSVIAILVALHILSEGWRLMRASVRGLMDEAMPQAEQHKIVAILDDFAAQELRWHNLRTRRAGQKRFIQVDLLVPPQWTVEKAHALADTVERRIAAELFGAHVSTHVEPIDPLSHST
ncbi:MAG: cation diffusion facilitator family transporter [Betaproteobacteria bacterium]|nr:cation diffusion facilitator family transporter [Betaproteobacteria bacterium]